MFARIYTYTNLFDTNLVYKGEVEVSCAFTESRLVQVGVSVTSDVVERAMCAIRENGGNLRVCDITVNFRAFIPNCWSEGLDLPTAMALLVGSQMAVLNEEKTYAFIGQLSLDGRVNPISRDVFIQIIREIKGEPKLQGCTLVIPEGNLADLDWDPSLAVNLKIDFITVNSLLDCVKKCCTSHRLS